MVLRGRAASDIRTGQWIKKYLESYGQACIADIHHALKEEIAHKNELRKQRGITRYHAPTYESFRKYFRNLVALGLLELVEEEAMLLPPPGAPLLSIRKQEGEVTIVESVRRLYRLTDKGLSEPLEERWGNPIRYIDEMIFQT